MITRASSNSTDGPEPGGEMLPGMAGAAAVFAIAATLGCAALACLLAYATQSAAALASGLAAAAVLAALLFRLKPANRLLASLCLLSLLVAVYGAEYAVSTMKSRSRVVAAVARRLGRPADRRSLREVVEDYGKQGIDAYPCCVSVSNYLESSRQERPRTALDLVPLATRSNSFQVMCNESGPYIIYRTDEHGFANPPGLWAARTADVVAIGDSFTLGFCVESGRRYTDVIRARIPATVNLGIRGSGPLVHLAVLKEYAAVLKPKAVIWAFYENDLEDLAEEKSFPILMQYVGSSFRQGLVDRQPEIDQWAGAIVRHFAAEIARQQSRQTLIHLLKLTHLRTSVTGRFFVRAKAPPEEDFALFEKILADARTTAASWGGTVYLAYLPGMEHFVKTPKSAVNVMLYGRVRQIAAKLGIPLVDVLRKFAGQPSPTSLFFYPGSHYTEEGNRLVAEAILAELARTAR